MNVEAKYRKALKKNLRVLDLLRHSGTYRRRLPMDSILSDAYYAIGLKRHMEAKFKRV